MTTLALKSDQQNVSDARQAFANNAQLKGLGLAFVDAQGLCPRNFNEGKQTLTVNAQFGLGLSGQLDKLLT